MLKFLVALFLIAINSFMLYQVYCDFVLYALVLINVLIFHTCFLRNAEALVR